jgi:predicted transcriptional regulator
MTESTREQFKHAILIEEAHHILSDQRRSLVGGQSVMEIIFREIREFGESLILLDQHPSKINLSALGNTYCTICMNLKHKTDINAVAQCLLLDAERQILGQLDTGKAVVKLQGRIANAFVVNIPEFHIEKGRITDKLIQEQMAGITEPFESEDFRLTGEDKQKTLKPEKIAPEQSALLRDIKENPQSGIAARYKRLGISVRQGQKIKEKLLSNKLITESIKTTDTGRRRSIELTDEGENILL